jgi:hypothetical protein
MSSDTAIKADQIAYRLFTKLYLLLYDARATGAENGFQGQSKTDKWVRTYAALGSGSQ